MPRRTYAVLLLAVLGLVIGAVRRENPTSEKAPGKGKLVVVAVFDQMRGDYLTRFAPHFGKDGFEKLKADGTWFANAHLPYACTSTGPGHASIATGVPPSIHGIIENEWYDRATDKRVYCSSGDRVYDRVPANDSAGKRSEKARGGLSPERLLAPALGDHLHSATENCGRSYSLAIKDRAAVLMGGQKPDLCLCFDPAVGEFHTSSYYRDQLPEWTTKFNHSRRVDAWFERDWTRLLDESIYTKTVGDDDGAGECEGVPEAQKEKKFPHTLKGDLKKPGADYYSRLERSPFGNDLLWELALEAIDGDKLGNKENPDLLYLGFSSNDLIGHFWGPDSHEVMDVTLRSDQLLAKMRVDLEKRLGDRFAIIVTADHGVQPLRESAAKLHPASERIAPRDSIAPVIAALNKEFGTPEKGAWIEQVSLPWLYLNAKLAEEKKIPLATVRRLAAKVLADQPHVLTAYTSDFLAGPATTTDPMEKRARNAYHPDRSGDILVVFKPYHLPLAGAPIAATHGSPHSWDTHVPLLAAGCGIPKGKPHREEVSSLLLAPIACRALGIPPAKTFVESDPWGE